MKKIFNKKAFLYLIFSASAFATDAFIYSNGSRPIALAQTSQTKVQDVAKVLSPDPASATNSLYKMVEYLIGLLGSGATASACVATNNALILGEDSEDTAGKLKAEAKDLKSNVIDLQAIFSSTNGSGTSATVNSLGTSKKNILSNLVPSSSLKRSDGARSDGTSRSTIADYLDEAMNFAEPYHLCGPDNLDTRTSYLSNMVSDTTDPLTTKLTTVLGNIKQSATHFDDALPIREIFGNWGWAQTAQYIRDAYLGYYSTDPAPKNITFSDKNVFKEGFFTLYDKATTVEERIAKFLDIVNSVPQGECLVFPEKDKDGNVITYDSLGTLLKYGYKLTQTV